MKHETLVSQQFGATAQSYLQSAVHASGEDLRLLGEAVAAAPDAAVLDLGCGAGHASFAVAPYAASVVAYDLSDEMLSVVQRAAQQRGLANLTVAQGKAEKVAFSSSSFDWVISRYSAHHWHDVPAALREARSIVEAGWSHAADRHGWGRNSAARHISAGDRVAPDEVLRQFQVESDSSFTLQKVMIAAA